MSDLNIYVSVVYSFPGAGVTNAQITYAPAIEGLENTYTQVENVQITSDISPPDGFPHIDDAIDYFFEDNFTAIKTALHAASGLNYTEGVVIRERPENYTIDFLLQNTLNDQQGALSDLFTAQVALSSRVDTDGDAIASYETRITTLETFDSGVTTALAGKQPLAASLTQVAATTSLSSNVVSMLSASDNAGIRTAIGAGTSSFDGAYASLTGKPTISTIGGSGNYYDASTKPADKSYSNKSSYTFVTTAAAANGDRLSTFRHTHVSYNVKVSSAVQIGVVANVSGYIALEIASTNSTTAGDWVEISRVGTGQNVGLAIALSSTQTVTGALTGLVPAGYYRRIRTVNENGTPTYTYLSGQEVLEEPLQVAA